MVTGPPMDWAIGPIPIACHHHAPTGYRASARWSTRNWVACRAVRAYPPVVSGSDWRLEGSLGLSWLSESMGWAGVREAGSLPCGKSLRS
jgi:hypothetical protein